MTNLLNEVQNRLPNLELQYIENVAIPLCLGDPRDPEDGCHDRFVAAISGYGSNTTLVIQTGSSDSLALCDLMWDIIKKKKKWWSTNFLSIPLGWGTRSEIQNAFAIIRELSEKKLGLGKGINTTSPFFEISIASNLVHLYRVRWFVKIYNTDKLKVIYNVAYHDFSFKSVVRELVGTPIIIVTDLFRGFSKLRKEAQNKFDKINSELK